MWDFYLDPNLLAYAPPGEGSLASLFNNNGRPSSSQVSSSAIFARVNVQYMVRRTGKRKVERRVKLICYDLCRIAREHGVSVRHAFM